MEENIYLRETLAMLDLTGVTLALESGAFEGGGSKELLDAVGKVYTIEIGEELAEGVKRRFEGQNVEVFCGRGQDGIKYFAEKIGGSEEFIYFSDSHYSMGNTSFDPEIGHGGCPVLEELENLKPLRPRWIIIDDHLDFGTRDYPSPETLRTKIDELGNYFCWVRNEKNHQLICKRIDE